MDYSNLSDVNFLKEKKKKLANRLGVLQMKTCHFSLSDLVAFFSSFLLVASRLMVDKLCPYL